MEKHDRRAVNSSASLSHVDSPSALGGPMMFSSKRRMLVAAMLLSSTTAHAHHAMDGRMPATFTEGLLSGLGHPVIGLDHLAAVVAVGLIASLSQHRVKLIAAFFVSMLCGVGLHVARLDVPLSEIGIALSLIAFGWLLIRASVAPAVLSVLVLALAGALHGYAYGESIVGAEPTPLGAYLLGLVVIQSIIALGVGYSAQVVYRAYPARSEKVSVASGALVVLLGVALLSF
jgi:urease accessory protein